jgi:Fur family ferric uptake transcriptional regulator
VLEAAARPLSQKEVLDQAREQLPTLNAATVYRNVKMLLDEGWLRRVDLAGDISRFESHELSGNRSQHFQCTRCKRVFTVSRDLGDLKQLAPRGFTVKRQELALYGS